MGFIKPNSNTLNCTPGFLRAVGLGTAGDRWGATAVRGLGETVEKETVGNRHLRRDGKMLFFYVIINLFK